jgi:hypothetical protein
MIFTKDFKKDIDLIKDSILNKKKFAFSKYADGERYILNSIKITNIDFWTFNPQTDSLFFNMLDESFRYKDSGYYIGISCPCCDEYSYNWFNNNKGSDESNTTFANIFVNGNYETFKNELIPTFNTYDRIVLVANKKSNLENIKNVLNFTDFFGIGDEAFKTDLDLPEKILNYMEKENIIDSLFLFCAGPMGNILSHKLWQNNKNNTYIDIGSTLNPWFERNVRDYQRGVNSPDKICKF